MTSDAIRRRPSSLLGEALGLMNLGTFLGGALREFMVGK